MPGPKVDRAGPHVGGVAEVAQVLGISKQRVHQLKGDRDFPVPRRCECGSIWDLHEIRAWHDDRARSKAKRRWKVLAGFRRHGTVMGAAREGSVSEFTARKWLESYGRPHYAPPRKGGMSR